MDRILNKMEIRTAEDSQIEKVSPEGSGVHQKWNENALTERTYVPYYNGRAKRGLLPGREGVLSTAIVILTGEGGQADMKDAVREILDYYSGQKDRGSQEMIVSMLRELQEAEGCITPERMQMAAQAAGVKESLIRLIVKRYPSLKEADYVHEILACSGPRCGAKQGMELLRILKRELEIGDNGISRDGRICLKTQNCLKQCRTSPNIMVDGTLYSHMDTEKVRELAEKMRKEG